MTTEQYMIFGLIILMLIFFVWGKWRYDIVALATLLIAVIIGLVPVSEAFTGFSHAAVITVAAILVVSQGLMNAGIIDYITKYLLKAGNNTMVQMTLLVLTVTISSAFINNIGALALMMPVAIKIARKNNKSPSLFLMPLAFGSLLGGMTTLVGTPPNIIISTYREDVLGEQFTMFDFTPVGGIVALAGVLFILLIGWRLIPKRDAGKSEQNLFEISDYIFELFITEDSKFIGKTLRDLEKVNDSELKIISLTRKEKNYPTPILSRVLQKDDSIIIEATAEELQDFLANTDLKLSESKEKLSEKDLSAKDIEVVEAVVMSNSPIIGKSAKSLKIRTRYGINLLGVAREGVRINKSPDSINFRVGDILLLQGDSETLSDILSQWKCLPLAERGITLGKPQRLLTGILIFIAALIVTTLGILPVQISFLTAAVIMVIANLVPIKELYNSIDWSIIILLGAIIPVSSALESTGGAQLVAEKVLYVSNNVPLWTSIMIILILSMTLSDIVNNAAAVLIMAPISLELALGLGVNPDAFLMSVAIGASCSFLTPIGHQSNTLVMGPGGYRFGDYWRMGLPLEIIIAIVATPLIMYFWL